ncbi:MAG: ORF6N domain-containing protein [Candidatus Moraniibacteriota bacterium]
MKNKIAIPGEVIENKIFLIRGKKVMLDRDLAVLYGVETRVLNQAVRRNIDRFPEDFMFQLTKIEMENFSRSQNVILKRGQNIKYNPYVFTEQGVAMLSSVLRSKRAIQVNIQIMRTFTKIREMIISNKELRLKIEALERKYDNKFQIVFDAIRGLLMAQSREKFVKNNKKIGFKIRK